LAPANLAQARNWPAEQLSSAEIKKRECILRHRERNDCADI
jgi:hypothetical protein